VEKLWRALWKVQAIKQWLLALKDLLDSREAALGIVD
jgi:hypothetical protein